MLKLHISFICQEKNLSNKYTTKKLAFFFSKKHIKINTCISSHLSLHLSETNINKIILYTLLFKH